MSNLLSYFISQQLKIAKLPIKCKIRFIPRQRYNPNALLPKSINNTYVDKFKNKWVKVPSRTAKQEFGWDVQLSKLGIKQLGWASRDGKHLNFSLDGKITHK